MSKKVYELAKELDMESKELLEKINVMGIEAKSHNSVISDIDVKAVTNMILHSRTKTTETKIVKAPPKKKTGEKESEVKISVKPAAVTTRAAREIAEQKSRQEAKSQGQRTTPKSASVQPPAGVPMPRAASVQPPAGIPMPKSASVQEMKEKKETNQPAAKTKETEPITEAVPKSDEESRNDEIGAATEQTEIPKGLVIKKRASEIVAEKAEKEMLAKAEAEKTASQEAQRSAQSRESGRQTQGQEPRRPSQGQETRRPSQGQETRRPGQAQETRRPGQGQDTRRPGQGQDTRRPSQGQEAGHPASNRDVRRQTQGGEDLGIPSGQKKSPAGAVVSPNKKDRDKKTKDFEVSEKAKKKDYRRKEDKQPLSMEKQVLKKYKKKTEKPVEEESSIDINTLLPGSKIINVPITVKGLSEQIEKSTSEIILALMKLGIMANVNQNIDEDTAVLLGAELGTNIVVDKVKEELVEDGLETFIDETSDLKSRPPIITVMGHVDHGKTSLLDAIRKTNVTSTESGGITQHIGASEVTVNGQRIVFLDTPGHEAFTAMRARGAHVTDIAVLVVAADDSVKPQTIESISHAKAAGIPIIVAINKTDKAEANPDRVKQDLANLPADQRVLVEEWGGDTISVPVSAKTGEGILNLLEMILLQAEVLELKANPNRLALGTVIEARLDKAKGPVATLLVLNGTLQTGMSVVVGTCSGKIRAMTNFKGDNIRKAGPATAVEILGLNEVPEAGDEFNAVKEDRTAREIAEQRRMRVREEVMVRNSSTTLEQLFSQIKEGEVKELNLIIKADVQGSVGALTSSLERLQTENVKVRIIHSGVGTITESDIMLASTSDAIIIGFNVRPSSNITAMAEHEKIEIRTYRVIYDIIDDVEAAMKGMLDPIFKEVVLGKIEIRNTFKVPGVGIVGGAYVLEGKVQRNSEIRLVRDGIVIHEGKISSLKRFKDDVKEVNQGYECGIGIENYNDIKEGDIIEAFKMEEIAR